MGCRYLAKSAKAYFVQAELSARQGQLSRAREALGSAEKLAPGLPFAKPEAVQAVCAQLASKSVSSAAGSLTSRGDGIGAGSWDDGNVIASSGDGRDWDS